MATLDLGQSYAVHDEGQRMASHLKHLSRFVAAVAAFVCGMSPHP